MQAKADFEQSEKELLDVMDTLHLQRAGSVIDALSVMVQALSINSTDAIKLTALVENSQTSEDVVHRGDFGGLKSNAESQRAEALQTEAAAIHNLRLLQQPLKMK